MSWATAVSRANGRGVTRQWLEVTGCNEVPLYFSRLPEPAQSQQVDLGGRLKQTLAMGLTYKLK